MKKYQFIIAYSVGLSMLSSSITYIVMKKRHIKKLNQISDELKSIVNEAEEREKDKKVKEELERLDKHFEKVKEELEKDKKENGDWLKGYANLPKWAEEDLKKMEEERNDKE